MSENTARSGGIGLCGALFLLFVALRLTEHIDWAWYWVASPLWAPLAALLGVGLLLVAVMYPILWIGDAVDKHRRARERRAAAAEREAKMYRGLYR